MLLVRSWWRPLQAKDPFWARPMGPAMPYVSCQKGPGGGSGSQFQLFVERQVCLKDRAALQCSDLQKTGPSGGCLLGMVTFSAALIR